MQIEAKTKENKIISQEVIWQSILKVTKKIGLEEGKALRIFLFMAISGGEKNNLRDRFRCCHRLFNLLVPPFDRKLPQLPKGRPLFAFLYNTASNMNNLLPVFLAAKNRNWEPGVITGYNLTIPSNIINNTTNAINISQLIAYTSISERFIAIKNGIKYYRTIYKEFKSLKGQFNDFIKGLRLQIITEIAVYAIASKGLRRLYLNLKPCCVVSTSDLWQFDHAIFSVARHAKIPGFVIQHGLVHRFWWPFVSDILLLWGKPFQNEMFKLGAPGNRLIVCGMPAADHLFKKYHYNILSHGSRKELKFLFLSATHGRKISPFIYEKFGMLFKEIVAATPLAIWFIKLHPSEDDYYYRRLGVLKYPNIKILPKSTSLEESMKLSTVACTLNSTAALEAMIMRKPVVVFDVDPLIRESAWWPRSGGGVYVSDTKEMLNFVKKASTGDTFLNDIVKLQETFLSKTFANPGNAVEAILDAIETEVKDMTNFTIVRQKN
jgi:glycosyltransferase involved in cell wall biosynthesis